MANWLFVISLVMAIFWPKHVAYFLEKYLCLDGIFCLLVISNIVDCMRLTRNISRFWR
jgi:hypothetical protein